MSQYRQAINLHKKENQEAIKAANAAIAKETGGRPLTMKPEDTELRKKWMDAYIKAGGEYKVVKPKGTTPKSPVQPCPLSKSSAKSKPWTKEGVLAILCKEDKDAVQRLDKANVYTFKENPYIYYKEVKQSDGTWKRVETIKAYGLGSCMPPDPATSDPGEVGIQFDPNLTNEEAAATLYHESIHLKQLPDMDTWPSEYEAWIEEEKFRIKKGMPPTFSGARKKDKKGVWIADEDKIKEHVRNEYPQGEKKDPNVRYIPGPDKFIGKKELKGLKCP